MSIGFNDPIKSTVVQIKNQPKAVVVNISTSGSRLGGAAIAAEWHSRLMSKDYPIELWRMWDGDSEQRCGALRIRNFDTFPRFKWLRHCPRKVQALLLQSDIPKKLTELAPELVHLQNPGPSLEFERVAKSCNSMGIKVVTSTHGFYEVFNPNYGFKFHERLAWKWLATNPIIRSFPFIDAFLSGYPAEKELLVKHGIPASKIHLVPNGIDTFFEDPPSDGEIRLAKDKFGFSDQKPILLYMGNHTANKGLDAVIRTAISLEQPVTLIIGGKVRDIDAPKRWKALIPTTSPLELIVTDYLSIAEQRVLYHAATMLLFPSMADTLPLTILEAMACGLPVIAYDTGGISYQLAERSGIVVQQGDESAFLDAVSRLLNDPALQREFSAKGRLRQNDFFTWSLAAQKTIKIYDDLLGKHKK